MIWIARLLRRSRLDRDLDRELRFHLDAAVADHMRAGQSRDEAMRRASIELGGLSQVRESVRDERGTRWLEEFVSDARFALRGVARAPALNAALIGILALGIGGNTAIWSVVDALMVRSLPIERPEELRAVLRTGISDDSYIMSHARYRLLARALDDSTKLAAMSEIIRMYVQVGEQNIPIPAQLVSGDWFPLLGVRPLLGRLITPDDDRIVDGHQVVVLGAGLWRTRFGADSGIVGKTIRLNSVPMTVIGVADPNFVSLTVGQTVGVWAPVTAQHLLRYRGNSYSSDSDSEQAWIPQPGIDWLTLVARVAPGRSQATESKLAGVFRNDRASELASRDSAGRAHGMRERLELETMSRGFSPLRDFYSTPLKWLLGSVALVLLMACANLAGLLQVKSIARSHEIAVRVAIGAKPSRLARQLLTESLTITALGGALGLLVSWWGSAALLKAAGGARPIPLDVAIDWRALAFTAGISIVTGVLLGLAPAIHAAHTDPQGAFRAGVRVSGEGPRRWSLGRFLVVGQIALSVVLVTAAGLFVRTFRHMMSVDPGYAAEHLVTIRLDVRSAGYQYAQLPALYDRLLEGVSGTPGVRSASITLHGPAGNARRISGFNFSGLDLPPGERQAVENFVTPRFFETTGVPLLRGRDFSPSDRADGPRVAILSRVAAQHFFGTEDVVGKRIGYGPNQPFEIIGVVGDIRMNSIREKPQRLIFYPLAQGPQEYITSIEARVSGDVAAMISSIQASVRSVDKGIPILEATTVRELLQRGLTRERLLARLAGLFAVLALLLAGIGLYGVIGYSVSRRTRELGVRLALGASPGGMAWLVIRDSLVTVALGLGAGVVLWLAVDRVTTNLVAGVQPDDALTMSVSVAILAAVGALAAAIPAFRAARVNPLEAIRIQ